MKKSPEYPGIQTVEKPSFVEKERWLFEYKAARNPKAKKRDKENNEKQYIYLSKYTLFKIHSSKFKPDPVSDMSQATEICKSYCVFFFCVSKNMFNCFLAAVVKLAELRSMSVVLNQFYTPNDLLYENQDVREYMRNHASLKT